MEVPTTLKEIKLSFSSKVAYEKEGVDALVQEMQLQIDDAKSLAESKQRENSELKMEIKKLEEAKALEGGSEDIIRNLQDKLKKTKEEGEGFQAEARDLQEKLERAEKKIDELTEECEKYNNLLSGHNNTAGSDSFNFKQVVHEMEAENVRLREELDHFKNLPGTEDYKKAQQKNAPIDSDVIAEKDKIIEQKENELSAVVAELESLKQRFSETSEETSETLRTELGEKQAEISTLSEQVETLTSENLRLNEQIVTIALEKQEQENQAKEKTQELEAENEDLKEQLKDTASKLENANNKILDMEHSGTSSSGIDLDVGDLFEAARQNANQFLNSAKAKADALIEETERTTADKLAEAESTSTQIKENAEAEAAQIKKNAEAEAEKLLCKAKNHMTELDNMMESVRSSIAEKLNEISGIASEHADNYLNAPEKFFAQESTDEDIPAEEETTEEESSEEVNTNPDAESEQYSYDDDDDEE